MVMAQGAFLLGYWYITAFQGSNTYTRVHICRGMRPRVQICHFQGLAVGVAFRGALHYLVCAQSEYYSMGFFYLEPFFNLLLLGGGGGGGIHKQTQTFKNPPRPESCTYSGVQYQFCLKLFFSGSLGVVWFIFWCVFVYSTPEQHPWISREEKEYLKEGLRMTKV